MTFEMFEFDKKYGVSVGGCDEAGRGPLAGPLVVAACKMPVDFIVEGIDDSKKLSPIQRERLYERIIKCAEYHVEVIGHDIIDKINILQATIMGMEKCVNAISAETVLIDAVKLSLSKKTIPIIKGDAQSYNIAAASIIAKVYRDRLMYRYNEQYPEYGFAANKGYGTAQHIEALKKYGPCAIHRRTFIGNFALEGYEKVK